MDWYVYMVECADGTYYTGVTSDLERRVREHNSEKRGAKYTAGRRPVRLVYSKRAPNRREALERESHIKKLSRNNKIRLAAGMIDCHEVSTIHRIK